MYTCTVIGENICVPVIGENAYVPVARENISVLVAEAKPIHLRTSVKCNGSI